MADNATSANSTSSNSTETVACSSSSAGMTASPAALSVQEIAAWVLRSGLRDYMSELVPVLLHYAQQNSIDKLEQISRSEVELKLKEKLSKRAFAALVKKSPTSLGAAGINTSPAKRRKPVGNVSLPAPIEVDQKDETNVVVFLNRAPVLQLWTVCAGKVAGFSDVEALAVAGKVVRDCSEMKKKLLGLSVDKPQDAAAVTEPTKMYTILGFEASIPSDEEEMKVAAEKSLRYIQNAFENEFIKYYSVMYKFATQIGKNILETETGYQEYERFRPPTSGGQKGFGEKGRFYLKAVRGNY